MAVDAYIGVAVDGAGKKVAMDQTVDAQGNTVYLQKALLIGDPADALNQIMLMNQQQLAVLRAILAVLSCSTNCPTNEEDFTSQD